MAHPLAPPAPPIVSAADVAAGTRVRPVLAGGAAFGLLTAAGAAHGGYFEGSWGWLTLAAAWLAALALALDRPAAVSRTGVAALGLLTAFAGWTLLSSLWSVDVTQTALEAQRVLADAAGFGALLLLARGQRRAVAAGIWASVLALCVYALGTKLVPDRFGVADPIAANRLSEPLGYWNALGLLAALGLVLALGFLVEGRRLAVRVAASASVPALALTVFFTSSRGAWAALAAGLLVWFAIDPRRLHALAAAAVAAPWSAAGVTLGWRAHSLTAGVLQPVAVQARDGHRLLLELAALVVCAGASVPLLAFLERRLAVGERTQRRLSLGLLAAAVAVLVAVFAVAGSPWSLAKRGWDRFTAPQAAAAVTPDVTTHLVGLSGSGRIDKWRIAWKHEIVPHPWLGTGAGTFERYWLRYRPTAVGAKNAHNLYLETLATLGPVGLALLLGLVVVPFWAAIRSRGTPLAPALLAAWTAFVLHAAIDWDWQVTALVLAALGCAAALLAGGAGGELSRRLRAVAFATVVVAGGLGLWSIAMQHALGDVASASDPAAAARSAADLQPWSTEPWQQLGERELTLGRFAAARAAFGKALAEDPGDWSLWYDLARASPPVPRIEALRKVDKLNPLSPEAAALRATIASIAAVSRRP